MQLLLVNSELKLSELEYLSQPTGSRDSPKTSQRLGSHAESYPYSGARNSMGGPWNQKETQAEPDHGLD